MSASICSIEKKVPTQEIVGLYKEAGWWNKALEGKIPEIVKGSFCFVVAKNDKNKIIGMGRVISDGTSDAYIQDVYVKKRHRNNGTGACIINMLIDYCKNKRIVWLGLVAEPGTETFYNKFGFTEKKNYKLMLLK